MHGFTQSESEKEKYIEDIKSTLRTDIHDTIKIRLLVEWSNLIYVEDPSLDYHLSSQIDSICSSGLEKKNLEKQHKNYLLGQKAFSNNVMGSHDFYSGRLKQAIFHFDVALRIYEQLDNLDGQSSVSNNMGNVYSDLERYDDALELFRKSEKINKAQGNEYKNGEVYNNIGTIYAQKADYDSSLVYFHMAVDKYLFIQDSFALATSYGNIGSSHLELENFDSAAYYFNLALEVDLQIQSMQGLSLDYHNLASLEFENGHYEKALELALKSNELALSMGDLDTQRDCAAIISKIYEYKNDYKRAFEYLTIYYLMDDSIQGYENEQAIISQKFQYEYDKKVAADSISALKEEKIQESLLAAEKAKQMNQKIINYVLVGGLGVVLIILGFAYRGYRRKKQDHKIISLQKEEVEKQKELIEVAHQEITDSIAYAKRIQSAILPPHKLVKEYLKDSFILYKPKDIVAGDFYWLEKQNNTILFAAADCTGHGVPGAMVSVVCNNGLNRSVREYGLSEPGKILDKTRELVISEFEKSEEEVKDGMDIALVSLSEQADEKYLIQYAGAHNPLWIIRKGAQEIEEIKGDKQPIGKHLHSSPFTTHQVELKKGDSIYVFSDGFADQFGGEKGKKFKAANFKKLLLTVQNESMESQRTSINKAFEEWKGSLEQLDDVCVIGVRL